MHIGEKIKKLRKERNLSQAQVAIKIGTDARRISNYENNINIPTTDLLVKIAEIFNVSMDYLVKADVENTATTPIRDKKLLEQFEEVDRMPEEEKKHIMFLIQSVIDNKRVKKLVQEIPVNP